LITSSTSTRAERTTNTADSLRRSLALIRSNGVWVLVDYLA